MLREMETSHRIAILATGDEIANGDIINTNSQQIAKRLSDEGMNVRTHMSAPDTIHEIEEAIAFLLKTHDALFITGGLGPTSDDLTRYALANVLHKNLVFDNKTWDIICARLKRFGYDAPPESNRQQALFPDGARIIPNPNGTAAGCMLRHDSKIIFMLPGPPNECLPMVDDIGITSLKKSGFQQVNYHHKWFLFGASEGQIAEELDQLAKPFECVTGYRLFYPYIEFKLHSSSKKKLADLVSVMEKTIQPYLIGDGQQIASQVLREKISAENYKLAICDQATAGLLETALKTPQTKHKLFFADNSIHFPADFIQIEIKGLSAYWENETEATHTKLEIVFKDQEKQHQAEMSFPYRGKRVIHYAMEYSCAEILKFLVKSYI